MPAPSRSLAGLCLIVGLAHFSGPSPSSAQGIYAPYIPYFPTHFNNTAVSLDEAPLTTRWLGADAAVETQLDADHSLWFFSDTMLSNDRSQARYRGFYPAPGGSMNYSLASNTIAIATHSKVADKYLFSPKYYCRGRAGAYTGFLPDAIPPGSRPVRPGRPAPRSALRYGPFILLFASRLVQGAGGGSPTNNTLVYRIDTRPGPTDPSRWTITPLFVHIYPDDATADIVFGASCFFMKDPSSPTTYVGTYGFYPKLKQVTGLRIPLDSLLGAPASTDVCLPYQGNTGAQYLTNDSTWKPGLYNSDALAVKNLPTDFFYTTRFVPDSGNGHWRAVLFQNLALYGYSPSRTFTYPAPPGRGPIPSPAPPVECRSAYVTTSASGPYGPFEPPTPLPTFPSMDPGNAASFHPDILCYGVAEQPDFATTPAQILLTYNTHSNIAMAPGTNPQQSFINVFNNPTGEFYTVFAQYGTAPRAPLPAPPPPLNR